MAHWLAVCSVRWLVKPMVEKLVTMWALISAVYLAWKKDEAKEMK